MNKLFSNLHSSSAKIFGIEVYSDHCPWVVDQLHTLFCNISEMKYWLLYRFHPKHQHHIVRTDLAPGYYCQDSRMLYACMKCLEDHIIREGGVEKITKWIKELREEHEAWGPDSKEICGHQANSLEEALAIYHWWTIEKPADQKRSDELTHLIYSNYHLQFEPCKEGARVIFPEMSAEKETMQKELSLLDEKIDADEQAMLHRLVEIRRTLWT